MSPSLSLVGTVSSAVLCLYVAGLSFRTGSAPGFGEHRWFGAVAFLAFVYSALTVATASPPFHPPSWLVLAAVSVQTSAFAALAFAWIGYARALLGERGRVERLLGVALPVAAALALVPGVAYHSAPPLRQIPGFGAGYLFPEMSAAGLVIVLLSLAGLVVTVVSLTRGWRRRVPGAGPQALALAVLVGIAAWDGTVAAGWMEGPCLSDVGLLVPIAAVGWTLTGRFVNDAHALDALRRGLQAAVEQRTEALRASQETLARTEKLAAVGQFAAGVAHQVSNPLAVISASLWLLGETRQPDSADSADSAAAIADAKAALARISTVARRLRDASRLASAPHQPGVATRLAAAVADAVALARAGLAPSARSVPVDVEVPGTLWAAAAEDLLVEVVANLVTNALEATAFTESGPRASGAQPARVRVTAVVEGEKVRLCVEDHGPGMPADVLAHVFEPFYSTKRDPLATGLGLAVSRGLVASAGGELTVESAVGRGTKAWVELAAGAPGPERE